MTYVNEKHNEAVMVETSLHDIDSALTNLSNKLYALDPKHPLLEGISEASHAIEGIDFEAPYETAKTTAGESWWVEA